MKNNFIFLYLAQKLPFLQMCVWSIRSLQKFGKFRILVIVNNLNEKRYLLKYLKEVDIKVIKVDIGKLNMWCWKPLLLKNLRLNYSNIIISDVDIIWHKDPTALLKRIGNKTWFHKITSIDPKEIIENLRNENIPSRRIGLINMVRFFQQSKIINLPNFHVNVGLFSVSKYNFKLITERWFKYIKKMNNNEIMTEAIISIALADLKIEPYCDIENIKHHFKSKKININYPIIKYQFLKNEKKGPHGYEYATHYHGDQRIAMCIKAREYKIDYNNFFLNIVFYTYFNKLKKFLLKKIW